METTYADLHIHSLYSDGTMSPQEIAEAAKKQGLSLIAITDHNILEGSSQLRILCEAENIGYLSGVELDCLDNGNIIHVLGYGVDLENEKFIEFTKQNRTHLDQRSVILIEKMSKDIATITPEDYSSFHYDAKLGGWKALHYFVSKGLATNPKDGIRYYSQYRCPFSIVDFPSVSTVCRAIKDASGVAVLAHPGETIDAPDMIVFRGELNRLVGLGLDGIECYYPTHTEEITSECVKVCKERNLITTSGSDCHGGFGKTSVGEMRITLERLNLKGLI